MEQVVFHSLPYLGAVMEKIVDRCFGLSSSSLNFNKVELDHQCQITSDCNFTFLFVFCMISSVHLSVFVLVLTAISAASLPPPDYKINKDNR